MSSFPTFNGARSLPSINSLLDAALITEEDGEEMNDVDCVHALPPPQTTPTDEGNSSTEEEEIPLEEFEHSLFRITNEEETFCLATLIELALDTVLKGDSSLAGEDDSMWCPASDDFSKP